jgi:HK97 family phage portal protein
MGILSRLYTVFGQKSVDNNLTYGGTWTPVGASSDSVHERNLLHANKEWVYIAVDKVAAGVTSVPIKVMRYRRNGDDQEVFDGPLVEFLERPGAGFTGKDFIYLNTVYKELTGNAFWERVKGNKVAPLIPTLVSPVLVGDRLAQYRYTSGATERTLKLEDVLHDRYIDPARPYWGAGKLQKIARWVDTSGFANEFLRRFFLNGATFGGFIETEEESRERIELIKLGLANDHVGVENAHKIAVLPKGAKFSQTLADMSQIEMGATDDRYRDKILAGFGVPKTLVGLTTEVNRASAEAAEYVFARYTVKPILDDLMEFLNVNVAKVLDPSGQYYFAYEEFVPVNMEVALKEREISLARQQYKTVNEVRAEVGLPPVPGGDVIYGAPFQVPLGQPQQAPEAPVSDDEDEDDETPTPPQKSRAVRLPERVRRFADREASLDSIADALATKLKDAPASREGDILDERELADEAAHKDFVSRVESFLKRMENTVRDFNAEQQRRVVKNLGTITKAVSKKDVFDMTEEIAIMVNFVEPILGDLLTKQAIAEYQAQGFAGKFDSTDAITKRVLERAARRLAKSYNNTTAVLLKRALNAGIQEGEGLGQLTKRVQEIYEFSDVTRARAVAHTETFYIANEGSREAYRQSGVVKTMRWYTAQDERVCPHCHPINGTVIDVNDVFFKKGDQMVGEDGSILKLNYRAINVPPLHTNCRCFIRPETVEIN